MAQFVAFAQGVKVNGETVLAVVNGMGAFKTRALELLQENGIHDPKPGMWYSQQAWLDTFKSISINIGPSTLNVIGKQIPESAQFPPGVDTLEKALASIDVAYKMNHQGGEVGNYGFIQTGDRSAKMVCANPYPCEFDRGITQAIAKRFKPKDSYGVRINHDDSTPCRKKDADNCVYLLEW